MADPQNPFIRCSKCRQAGECEPDFSGAFSMYGYSRSRCCVCIPKRICVHLDLYEDLEYPVALTISTNVNLTCASQSFSGVLRDPGTIHTINFQLFYVQDDATRQCYFALQSTTLGYIDETTLLIPMGGAYNDGDIRRADCETFEWAFDVTLDYVAGPYLTTAVIRVTEDDLVPMPRNCQAEALCFAKRACITYQDSYGTEQTQQVCFVDEKWLTTFYDAVLETNVSVQIEMDNWDVYLGSICEDVPALTITSSLGTPYTANPVDADCPTMAASWGFTGGQRVSIVKDPRWALNEFADCGCICRCICVTLLEDALYATPPPRMMVGTACMEELAIYGCGDQWLRGWNVTLTNSDDPYDTMNVLIWLEYDCETEATLVHTSLSDATSAIVCPDFKVGPEDAQQDITFAITPGGGAQPYLLTIRCLACTDCTMNGFVTSNCCPYSDIPVILNLEVTGTNAGCANILGASGSLVWNGDEFTPEWSGIIVLDGAPVEFILTCGGACGTTWCLTGCAEPIQQGEGTCDPFQLTFTSFGGCASCDDGAVGEYTVTITA